MIPDGAGPAPKRRCRRALIAALMAAALAAAAAPAAAQLPGDAVNDPLEPMNRAIFRFNEAADRVVLRPAARAYGVLPSPMRTGVRNFLDNLRSPVIFVNDLMQGERDRAGTTFARFMINTLLGGAGLFDVATAFGHPKHSEDFGQTLGRYGVAGGPFLMLPLLGPSTARDAFGFVVDAFLLDPVFYLAPMETRIGRTTADGVDTRQRLDPAIEDVRANSIDAYATFRTIYLQQRAAAIRNGTPFDDEAYEDIFRELDEPDGPPAE
ncbi:MAG TPA: VacJ family lipoprotein [Geminicoccaceae bacterium]|nr:VacJ family lipoprotein [Geminicoccaceae bacterium]